MEEQIEKNSEIHLKFHAKYLEWVTTFQLHRSSRLLCNFVVVFFNYSFSFDYLNLNIMHVSERKDNV